MVPFSFFFFVIVVVVLVVFTVWDTMAADRKQANMKTLSEAADVQEKTKETIFRIQRTAAETEAIGAQTLDELRRQGAQMVGVAIDKSTCVDDVLTSLTLIERMTSMLSWTQSVPNWINRKLCRVDLTGGLEIGWALRKARH